MADFENFEGTAASIVLRIQQKFVALNIDWHDEVALKQLANEALQYDRSKTFPGLDRGGVDTLAHMELCGLIALMNQTITEGAVSGQDIHGDEVWKALARALWMEKGGGSNSST